MFLIGRIIFLIPHLFVVSVFLLVCLAFGYIVLSDTIFHEETIYGKRWFLYKTKSIKYVGSH